MDRQEVARDKEPQDPDDGSSPEDRGPMQDSDAASSATGRNPTTGMQKPDEGHGRDEEPGKDRGGQLGREDTQEQHHHGEK